MNQEDRSIFQAFGRAERRRGLIERLNRIPSSDSFARMLVMGKIKAIDRESQNSSQAIRQHSQKGEDK